MNNKEYLKFINSEEIRPSSELDNRVRTQILNSLNPTLSRVVKKLSIVHFVSAILTLSVCPQFGIGPIGGGNGITSLVLQYGDLVCGLFCGAVFMGTTAFVSLFVFNKAEIKILYRNSFWLFPLIAFLSVIVLMTIGNTVGEHSMNNSINFIIPWILSGALISIMLVRTKLYISRYFD
ncbi:MAG: hypothetical protein NTY22_05120 [Proteobacteria bacterium]|nr:hypothetical protein [Pseudomonadota bacterium]